VVLTTVVLALVLFGIPEAMFFVRRPWLVIWLLSAAALASLWHNRQDHRRRLTVLTIAFTLLTLYSLPACSYLLCAALESRHPPLGRRPSDIEAIVVLAGGLVAPQAEGLQFELADNVVNRCLLAAEMYRQGAHCPVLVSGGKADPDSSEPSAASVMKRFLIQLGVVEGDLIEEDTSRSTYENAVECARVLRERRIQKVLLVTDGLHLDRALRCVQKEGVTAVGCGCNYRTLSFEWTLHAFMPNTSSAQGVRAAAYEHAALAWYAFRGRI